MAEFEIIEDIQKAIPKGKDLKKMTPFIIGGVVLGLGALLFTRRSPAVVDQPMTDDGVGDDVDLGGLMSDFANQTNQALQQNNQEMSYQLSEVAGNLFDVIGQQNEVINQLQKEFTTQLKDISSSSVVPVYQQASAVQNYSTTPNEDNFSIYFDGVDDDIQYNNVVKNVQKAVSSGSISSKEGKKIKKEIAGLGNDGVGWTAEGYKDNKERLASSPDHVRSEIERANLVIENRKASGLSTKLQEEYKERLVSGKEWTQ